MKLRYGNQHEETFETNKGSPQGDAISGIFFNIAFENELRHLRYELNKNVIQIEHDYCKRSKIPDEMIYADDSDFTSENSQRGDKKKTSKKKQI